MNKILTVSTVSKSLGISSRMIRYYEHVGLIESQRMDDYAYRVYDEDAIRKLRQIIILRKLRVPVKQISEIFDNNEAAVVIDVFERNISELDDEITALSTVKSILVRLVDELREKANVRLQLDYLGDSSVFAIVESISLPKNILQEEKSMSDLNKANEQLGRLTDKNVRIVYLPPSDVAAYQYEGDEPEDHVGQVIDKFVRESGLAKVKPDLRHYGFNSPDPDETGYHGYEMWVTIPDGFEVPEPLTKKRFDGGLYGAHMIMMGAFDEWQKVFEWSGSSEKYDYRSDASKGNENMNGLLEEYLNYFNRVSAPDIKISDEDTQLDLLIPIKVK
jgi:DNA-binding transcriptional MerR regulator/DNA gyrase inhibitor GyrI